MHLKELQIEGFKSFRKRVVLPFPSAITAIVGPNGSGKSNVTEAFRFVLGEQSMKTLRGKRGEDLIFNGGNSATRANKASVTVILDNDSKIFGDTFTEISIARTVYRDGTNEYAINGSQVRHRDIVEMLAKANIGATGHHIISQGEADRILNASPEERKEMLEDGLGLKLLQYRRIETEKKLRRAQENMVQTDLILKELAPRVRYLKRQVSQYEKAKKTREELKEIYAEYLAREIQYIAKTRKTLERESNALENRIKEIKKEMVEEEKQIKNEGDTEKPNKKIQKLQETLQDIRNQKDKVSREIGRIEGERNAIEAIKNHGEEDTVSRENLEQLHNEVYKRYTMSDGNNYGTIVSFVLKQLKRMIGHNKKEKNIAQQKKEILKQKQEDHEKKRAELEEKEKKCLKEQEEIRATQEYKTTVARRSEKNILILSTKRNTAEQNITELRHAMETLREDEEDLKREIREGTVLIGAEINKYKETSLPQNTDQEKRSEQKERKRALERKKIKLETIGTGGGEEAYKEYEEVSERMQFLTKEKKDLAESIHDCEEGTKIIQKEIDIRFNNGVKAVSSEFEKFFKILFDGGKASIAIERKTIQREDEEPEIKTGIAVNIALPRKKITALEQLSGGERALVSIALLFAISQITPPPFLILDETDAALDEANSRRYGNMIESLAKQSQLILVTHNRETMHHAGALYGVTMGTSGISSLLSVQFEEAVQVAK